MQDDFRTALARVQSDYAFYVSVLSDPETALADYSLTTEERLALTDPDRLTDAFTKGNKAFRLPTITITISGSHDWVNRAAPKKDQPTEQLIAHQVETVKSAVGDEERDRSALRLIQMLG